MKNYLLFIFLFPYFLLSQEMNLNISGSYSDTEKNCIAGNCYNGIGVQSNNGFIYFGEFFNGKANGLGAVYGNDILILSEYELNKRLDLQLRSKNGKNVITYSKDLAGKPIRKSDKKQVFLSDYYQNKVTRFKNDKPISNSTEFIFQGINKFDNFEITKYKKGGGVPSSIRELRLAGRSLVDKITRIGQQNNNRNNQDYLYSYFLESKNFQFIYKSKIQNWFKSNNLIAISYPQNDVMVLYIGSRSKNGFLNTGIYATINKGKVIDISFIDNKNEIKIIKKEKFIAELRILNKTEIINNSSYTTAFDKIFSGNSATTEINNKIKLPPNLEVGDFKFIDSNNNNLIEVNESSRISFNLTNKGAGPAYGISVNINDVKNIPGVIYDKNKYIGNLSPQETVNVIISINSTMSLLSGISNFEILIKEENGFDLDKISYNLETQEFISPNLSIVDFQFISENEKIKLGSINTLQFLVQNIGQGIAEDVNVIIDIPSNVFAAGDEKFVITQINPGEGKQFDFHFFTNNKFEGSSLNIKSFITEKYNKDGLSKVMSVEIGEDVSKIVAFNPEVTMDRTKKEITKISLTSLVDKNIPIKSKVEDRYALIIGNEDYSSYQTSLSFEQNVDYAINDANVFKDYALKTLGVKEDNLTILLNATSGQMNQEIDLITRIVAKIGTKAELIVFYAGHGFPDEQTKAPYLIPVDVTASNLSSAIKLEDFYTKLSSTNASKVTVFLDACFTGGGRNKSLVSSRGIKIKPKQGSLSGNLVVFSASNGNQSSLPFHKEKHGMFTYHLLKKLQVSKGKVSLGELSSYLKKEVSIKSLIINEQDQEPIINFSQEVKNYWSNWSFR